MTAKFNEYVATKPFRYGTRSLRAGDVFEATPQHGKLLVAIKKARPTTGEDRISGKIKAPPKSLTDKLEGKKAETSNSTGGRFKRRSTKRKSAEPAAKVEAETKPTPEVKAPEPVAKPAEPVTSPAAVRKP